MGSSRGCDVFGGTLCCIIRSVLVDNPRLGSVNLRKAELYDSYMQLWVRLKDTPPVAFLIPRKKHNVNQFVGFHIIIPMGYVDSAPCLCMYTETISYMANVSMDDRHRSPTHPLEFLADVPSLAE